MFTFGLTDIASKFDPLVLLLMALVLEAYFGEMRLVFKAVPHPVRLIGGLIAWLDTKLNREHRSQMDRAMRGAFSVLVVVTLAGAIGWTVAWITLSHDFGWVIEVFALVTLLAGRELFDRVSAVRRALDNDGAEAGREAVSHIVGRDPAYLDEHGIARASIESLAENFSDAVVAPVFWYVLFGFPGLLVYKAVNTLDSQIGYMNPKYRAFGMTAARLDDIVNFIPARLSGLLIAIAAIIAPRANPWVALKTMMLDAGKHRSTNAGWPEAAMAGAIGLALAGPRKYATETVNDPWIGNGRARATTTDMEVALYIYMVANLVNGLVVAVIAMVRFGLSA